MSAPATTPGPGRASRASRLGGHGRYGRFTRPVAVLLVLAVGVLGLVFGALPKGGADSGSQAGGVEAGDMRVSGVYVREPASPGTAAAYLSLTNTGDLEDRLLSASTGAARTVTLHDVPGDSADGPDGTMDPTGPISVLGGDTVTLSPGHGHIMLEGLTGPLRAGDQVNLLLSFTRAGQVLVEAPVIAIGAPAPTPQDGDGGAHDH